ncbi:hypothetical protein ACQ9ZH_20920 [Pseudomonas chlororaphis]
MKIEEKIKQVSSFSDDEIFAVIEADLQELVTFYVGNSVYLRNSPVLVFVEARLEEIEEFKDNWLKIHDIHEQVVSYIEKLKLLLPDLIKKQNSSFSRKRKSSGDKDKVIDKHESLREG